ncbi:hypothetical protein B0H99_101301 [Planomicrobium soli]|uniref:Uncharacterized protein n=1 Tax=Planomicrobium soli TaxID=1176648 RepID=A0A2P8H763_9BACL|nr:hypothetical protein [Planomicrobium soli]PSL42053.1 hypothetical protein B0H99_101301 [Planomicrobium soli]
MEKKNDKKKENGIVKDCFAELGMHILFEIIINIIWNILLFIPRVIIRFLLRVFSW